MIISSIWRVLSKPILHKKPRILFKQFINVLHTPASAVLVSSSADISQPVWESEDESEIEHSSTRRSRNPALAEFIERKLDCIVKVYTMTSSPYFRQPWYLLCMRERIERLIETENPSYISV